MNRNGSGPRRSPTGRNNRRSQRLVPPTKELAAVYVGSNRFTGVILDESQGGFGVLLDQSVEIKKGARVRITARRKCSPAVVVRCIDAEDGGCVVGLKT